MDQTTQLISSTILGAFLSSNMQFLIAVLIAIFGLIVGSFINVWTIRLGNDVSRYDRSRCLSCGYGLRSLDLIPVLSFFALGGRCRSCKTRISMQYPAVELLTATLFVLIFFRNGIPTSLFDTEFWTLTVMMVLITVPMIAMTVYDIRHKIVPFPMLAPFIIFSSIFAAISYFFGGSEGAFVVIAGILLFVPFLALWWLSRGAWIGFGDILLIFGIGVLLGFWGGISAILLAFWSATAFLIVVMLPLLYIWNVRLFNIKKDSIMKSEIPLVPFLMLGTFVTLVFEWNIFYFFL